MIKIFMPDLPKIYRSNLYLRSENRMNGVNQYKILSTRCYLQDKFSESL
jgi:hypothetical protein